MNRIAVVANLRSGAAARLGREALDALVRETLGSRLDLLDMAEPDAIPAALKKAFEAKPDAVAVIGGDGTARAAAELSRTTGIPVAFLPGGTMNLLPKRIWGDLDLKDALAAIGTGETTPIKLDAGEIGGQIFLVAAMFGAAPGLTRLRETFRRTASLREMGRVGATAARDLGVLTRPTVRILEPEGVGRIMPALVVTPGDAALALGRVRTDEIDTPSLECVAATVKGWPGLLAVMLRVMVGGDWRRDPRLVAFNAPRVLVGARGKRLRVTLDGELAHAPNPAAIRFLPEGLSSLGPRVAALPEPKTEAAV